MFGPGCINGVLSCLDTVILVQARDGIGQNRTCGFDKFTIIVSTIELDEKTEERKAYSRGGCSGEGNHGPGGRHISSSYITQLLASTTSRLSSTALSRDRLAISAARHSASM